MPLFGRHDTMIVPSWRTWGMRMGAVLVGTAAGQVDPALASDAAPVPDTGKPAARPDLVNRARDRAAMGLREHGLALLTAMTAAEIFVEATPEQIHGFYSATGRRLARLTDLADVRDLDGLTARINTFWATCAWGEARLYPGESGIKVLHCRAPVALEGDPDGHWARLFPALLEGAYDGWFRQLGSDAGLTTRIVSHDADVVELHHGY